MKRTIVPIERQRVKQENIHLNIKEKDNSLEVEVKLSNLDEGNYPADAQIILEAYNRTNIDRIKLGKIQDYKEEKENYPLQFDVPIRARINFRLKIISPETYKLLGYAENLKEKKYAKSLLNINILDDVENIYKIDFDNIEHPVLELNNQLSSCAEQLRPILAEMALKDILNHLLFIPQDNDFNENKWFKFANGLVSYNKNDENDENVEDKLEWINQVLCEFSKKKVIEDITTQFKKND